MSKKLRTSEDVFDRLKWDTSLNTEGCMIGYLDRFKGILEMKLMDYVPGGDVPFHRIYYFRNIDGYLWDRETKLDLVFKSGSSSSVHDAACVEAREIQLVKSLKATEEMLQEQLEAQDQRNRIMSSRARQISRRDGFMQDPTSSNSNQTELVRRQISYRFLKTVDNWSPFEGEWKDKPEGCHLKVMTYNILFDEFNSEDEIHTQERIPYIIESITDSEADMICLQEVTPRILASIMQNSHIRNNYFSSCPPNGETIEPHGQVIFSKFPFQRLLQLNFPSTSKKANIGLFNVNGSDLLLITLHLTSDHAKDGTGPLKRRKQLLELKALLQSFKSIPIIIAGDFNSNSDSPLDILNDFNDTWEILMEDENGDVPPGFTFDPITNPLAKFSSLSGIPKRLDRIIFRNPNKLESVKPLSISISSNEPIILQGKNEDKLIYPSDHFSIISTFEVKSQKDQKEEKQTMNIKEMPSLIRPKPVFKSAAVIIPPVEFWSQIDAIRRSFTPDAKAMPHITLLHKFWPDSYFDSIEDSLVKELKHISPFQVTFNNFSSFSHQNTNTIWLQPETTEDQIHQIYSVLSSIFPECLEDEKHSTFTPHMSIASRVETATVKSNIQEWKKDWKEISFKVGEIFLISRKDDGPFEIKKVIKLGEMSLNGCLHYYKSYEKQDCKTDLETVTQSINSIVAHNNPEFDLDLVGSRAINLHNVKSDYDFVVTLYNSKKKRIDFYNEFKKQASSLPIVESIRVSDSKATSIHLTIMNKNVNIQVITCKNEVEDNLALSAIDDTSSLKRYSELYGPIFYFLSRTLKCWAQQRGLASNSFGYFPGISFPALTICFLEKINYDLNSSSLSNFEGRALELFEYLYDNLTSEFVTNEISESVELRSRKRDKSHIQVIAPALPIRNLTRNVCSSTLEIIREELNRVIQFIKKGDWFSALEPLELESLGSNGFIFLKLKCPSLSSSSFKSHSGWVEGKILGLILQIEKEYTKIRPIPGHSKGEEIGVVQFTICTWGSCQSLIQVKNCLTEFVTAFQSLSSKDFSLTFSVTIEGEEL